MSVHAFGEFLLIDSHRETRGRSYVELDELFERRIPARQFATTMTSAQVSSEEFTKAQPE